MSNPALISALKSKFGAVKGSGEWLRIPCPTCEPHNRKKMKRYVPSFGYTSNCFICGIKVDVADLLDGYYIPNAKDMAGIDFEEEKQVDPRALVLPYNKAIPVNQLPESHPAVQFLYKDELRDLDTYANMHKIVFVPFDGGVIFHNSKSFITSAERLVFPVYFENKLVGWQMRSLPGTFYGDLESDVRYYHLFNKGSYLYNYDQARKFNRVIVVEGVKKALKFPNGVATWGTGISRRQLKLIQSWPEVIMMLDADENPRSNTQKRAKEFVDGINAGGASKAINVNLEKYGVKSPDDLPANILQLIAKEEWDNEQIHI
jgi:hypothetical protein